MSNSYLATPELGRELFEAAVESAIEDFSTFLDTSTTLPSVRVVFSGIVSGS